MKPGSPTVANIVLLCKRHNLEMGKDVFALE